MNTTNHAELAEEVNSCFQFTAQTLKQNKGGCYIPASTKLCDNIHCLIMKQVQHVFFVCVRLSFEVKLSIFIKFSDGVTTKNNLICTSLQQNDQMKHACDRYFLGKGESHKIHLI